MFIELNNIYYMAWYYGRKRESEAYSEMLLEKLAPCSRDDVLCLVRLWRDDCRKLNQRERRKSIGFICKCTTCHVRISVNYIHALDWTN